MWTAPRTWVTGEVVTSTVMNTHVRDNLIAILPVGSYLMRAADYTTVETAVEGRWLQCNGVAVSRTTYSELFAHLNALSPALPFGVGNGSTTFNLPDARGRGMWAEGEHTQVDTMGDSDGVAVTSRSANHAHNLASGGQIYLGGAAAPDGYIPGGAANTAAPLRTAGNQAHLDTPSFLVFGSYFIKYTA